MAVSTSIPRRKATALEHALKLLGIRARSKFELERALQEKGFSETELQAALCRLVELGYLDDSKFSFQRAFELLSTRKWGEGAVMAKLTRHGLTPEQAREGFSRAAQETDFDARHVAQAILDAKGLDPKNLTRREKGRAFRLLSSRGFDQSLIETLLPISQQDD